MSWTDWPYSRTRPRTPTSSSAQCPRHRALVHTLKHRQSSTAPENSYSDDENNRLTGLCRCLTLRDFTTGYLRGAPPSGCTAGSRISVTATVDALYSTRFISDFGFLCVNHVFLCSYSEWKSIRAHKGGLKNFRAGRRGSHGLLFGPQSAEEWRTSSSH